MRKIIIAVVACILVGGTYFFYTQQQAKMLEQFKAQIEAQGIISESIEFDPMNQKIILRNTKFERKIQDINLKVQATLVELIGFEQGVSEEEIIIKEVNVENVMAEANTVENFYSKLMLNRLDANNLVINQINIQNSFNAPNKFNFINIFLDTPHEGLELLGAVIDIKERPDADVLKTTFDRGYFSAHNGMSNITFEYENLKVEDNKAKLTAMRTIITELNHDLVSELFTNYEAQGFFEKLMQEIGSKTDLPLGNKIFSTFEIENLGLIVKDEMLAFVEDKEITIDKLYFNIDSSSNLTVTNELKNLEFSSEYVYGIGAGLEKVFGNALPEQIVLNYNSKNVVNPSEKTRSFEIDTDLTSFFDSVIKSESIYSCENIWDVVLMTDKGFACSGFTSYEQKYADLGLIPIIAKIINQAFGMPVGAMISTAESAAIDFVEHLKTDHDESDLAIAEILNALVDFIKKPGKIDVELKFNEPVYIYELEGLPTNFEHKINLEQGEKTLEELVAE